MINDREGYNTGFKKNKIINRRMFIFSAAKVVIFFGIIVLKPYIHQKSSNIHFNTIIGYRCAWRLFWVYWRAPSPHRSEKRNHWKWGEICGNLAIFWKNVVLGYKKGSKSKADFIFSSSMSFRSYITHHMVGSDMEMEDMKSLNVSLCSSSLTTETKHMEKEIRTKTMLNGP